MLRFFVLCKTVYTHFHKKFMDDILENGKTKIKSTLRQMSIYGYIKSGCIFRIKKVYYKFVSYAYDYVDGKQIELYLVWNLNKNRYEVLKASEYENKIGVIEKEANNTKIV